MTTSSSTIRPRFFLQKPTVGKVWVDRKHQRFLGSLKHWTLKMVSFRGFCSSQIKTPGPQSFGERKTFGEQLGKKQRYTRTYSIWVYSEINTCWILHKNVSPHGSMPPSEKISPFINKKRIIPCCLMILPGSSQAPNRLVQALGRSLLGPPDAVPKPSQPLTILYGYTPEI